MQELGINAHATCFSNRSVCRIWAASSNERPVSQTMLRPHVLHKKLHSDFSQTHCSLPVTHWIGCRMLKAGESLPFVPASAQADGPSMPLSSQAHRDVQNCTSTSRSLVHSKLLRWHAAAPLEASRLPKAALAFVGVVIICLDARTSKTQNSLGVRPCDWRCDAIALLSLFPKPPSSRGQALSVTRCQCLPVSMRVHACKGMPVHAHVGK